MSKKHAQQLLAAVEATSLRTSRLNPEDKDKPEEEQRTLDPVHIEIGANVDVHCRILEGTKERIQVFSGVVIARKGSGVREVFTVRRIVAGEGVERTFPMHSPKVAKVEVTRYGRVRRAKLYYLRDRTGKATRLRERMRPRVKKTSAANSDA